jgi:hypothetical protein
LIAIRSNLAGERLAVTGILRQARLVRSEAIAGKPLQRQVLLHPVGSYVAKLVQGPMHRFEDTFQPVERADRRQDLRGIGPLVPRAFTQPRALQAARKVSRNRWPAS